MLRSPKKLIGAGILGGLVLVATAAVALWTSSGTGSGSARALSAAPVTVSAAAGGADLYPGFTLGDVSFTLTNANPYGITFTSMVAGTVTSSNQVACPAANVTVIGASSLSLGVAAGATSAIQSINDVVSMASTAPDGCQGISFTVTLTLSGGQS
jgi:hypothetical protein